MKAAFLLTFTACFSLTLSRAEDVVTKQTFDTFDPSDFITKIPNKNTEVRDGVLWTRGASGGKYPPMVYLPVSGADISISFRYRHLGDGGWLWFFVDGDDGGGGTDHQVRLKLLRDKVQIEVNGHTLVKDDSGLQPDRPADKVSGMYRTREIIPAEPLDLSGKAWKQVHLVFRGKTLEVSIDGDRWKTELKRDGFDKEKRKLLWMQNGGEAGIELDDIEVLRQSDR